MHLTHAAHRARIARLLFAALLASVALAGRPHAQEASGEQDFLSNIRQVTFEGRRAGEGYFSPDGSLMIFQSERESSNPFYQIYVMDLDTGDTHRVSPGTGKTTCSWIHPSMKRVLYASTHEDPRTLDHQKEELELRASGRERRYAWDYDEHFEIYVDDIDGGNPVNVTRARGYDAEGSFSPDGKLIAFSSNRHAYSAPLSDADRRRFEFDQAYFLDLYLMNADGSEVRRLTDVRGYDGGPFFSPDGKRICFRRFNEKGDQAEVYTIGIDGKNEKQLTRLGAMSWAPYYHPSGDYLIFTTNRHGFANFELYLVDVNGRSEPVRVTTTDGFDGLPVFLPDGKRLAWASTRNGNRKGQIFFADWNDALARKRLGIGEPELEKTADEIRSEDLELHVRHLASERMAGRATGSDGERLAGDYLARVFSHVGLQPAGDGGTFFQSFEFTAGVVVGPESRLWRPEPAGNEGGTGGGTPRRLDLGRDWRPLAFSGTGRIEGAPVVFAGYGLTAPAVGKHPAYDAYDGLEVGGHWAMVLDGAPEGVATEWREHLARHANPRFKAIAARERGAIGLIVVQPDASWGREATEMLRHDSSAADAGLFAIAVSESVAAAILAAENRNLGEIEARLDRGEWAAGFPLHAERLAADVRLTRESRRGRNVLGRLPAGEAPIASAIVFGAHYDHLGHGETGNSLARDDEAGGIHFGADDNASGVAGMLEAAQYLASLKRKGKLAMKRDLIFAAWSGEEIGLLGSTAFVRSQEGLGGAGSVNPPIAACLNLDMIGRLREKLLLQGVGSSSIWLNEIERRNAPVGLAIQVVEDSLLPTDTTPFYLHEVPVLTASTGAHADYHSPRDTADKLDPAGAARIARLMALIARGLVTRDEAPDYREVPLGSRASRTRAKVALGTMPDYGADVRGVKIEGVRKGSPADRAGVRGEDVVVELAGKKVGNIYDYLLALDAMEPGKTYKLVVLRGGERVTLDVVPEAK